MATTTTSPYLIRLLLSVRSRRRNRSSISRNNFSISACTRSTTARRLLCTRVLTMVHPDFDFIGRHPKCPTTTTTTSCEASLPCTSLPLHSLSPCTGHWSSRTPNHGDSSHYRIRDLWEKVADEILHFDQLGRALPSLLPRPEGHRICHCVPDTARNELRVD